MYALVLTNWNLANSSTSQEQSNKERFMGCIIYVLNVFNRFSVVVKRATIYLHWRGAFGVARFDLSGNARASIREASDRTGSTLFYMYRLQG